LTVFLHLGAPKTGTTSIQTTLFKNAERLRREYSINYPTAHLNHWPIVLPYTDLESFRPLRNHILRRAGTTESYLEVAKKLTAEMKRNATRYQTHVVSSEMLLNANRAALTGLKGFFESIGHETRVLLYVRHPVERLSSLLSQDLRNGVHDINTFPITDRITSRIKSIVQIFERDEIIIRQFGDKYFRNGDLFEDFTTIINGEPIIDLNPEKLNESLSAPAAILAQHFYKIAPQESGRRFKHGILEKIPGPKFRAPRWMAEKTMEVHREGLAYLASEFGLHFHEVDLSVFPEELDTEFPPEAMMAVARILNDQSLKIEELLKKLKHPRLRRRIKNWFAKDIMGILS
jgi:hypothetical protein